MSVEEIASQTTCEYTVLVRRFADTEDTSITVSSRMTVSQLKGLVKERLNVAETMQKLVLGEDTMLSDDDCRLESYGVEADSNILVVKVVENPFAVGREIEGKDANGRWMPGIIKGENSDGTLVLELTDTSIVWPRVHKGNMRPIPEFQEGESLEGLDSNGEWQPIIVKAINGDSTYACDVFSADGSVQWHWERILRRNMRYVIDFNDHPDAHYYGLCNRGTAWPVKITKKNENGSYFCEVQDGQGTQWAEALRYTLW